MKKVLIIVMLLLLGSMTVHAQMGEWTWMNGSDSTGSFGHYGTQGVFNPANTPPGLYEACEWTDKDGNFWLFGGTFDYGDLWEYKPSINQWAWIKGPGITNQFGVYGVQGVPSITNYPGCRAFGALTWVDTAGNLWLFSGNGYASTNAGYLNDLWMYSIPTNEWTWMSGSDTAGDPGSYGTIHVTSATNMPPSRNESSGSWIDNNNNLWFYGGQLNANYFSDMWRYSIALNEWTWMSGVSYLNGWANYGTKGVPSTSNMPSGRSVYAKWKDSNGQFWLFGGRQAPNMNGGYHNDLWRFNPASFIWTWMSGTDTLNDTLGVAGILCSLNSNNMPGARFENRASWTINCDNFIFFGGYNQGDSGRNLMYNDLWDYSEYTNEWTRINGTSQPNQSAHYGTKLVSSPANIPPPSMGSVGWKDNSGNLWKFGGTNLSLGNYNDLWKFVPDSTCPAFCTGLGISELITNSNAISLYPNPTSGTFTLSYHLSTPDAAFQLLDISGRVVYKQSISGSIGNEIIDASALSSGMYFWQVANEKGVTSYGKIAIVK